MVFLKLFRIQPAFFSRLSLSLRDSWWIRLHRPYFARVNPQTVSWRPQLLAPLFSCCDCINIFFFHSNNNHPQLASQRDGDPDKSSSHSLNHSHKEIYLISLKMAGWSRHQQLREAECCLYFPVIWLFLGRNKELQIPLTERTVLLIWV